MVEVLYNTVSDEVSKLIERAKKEIEVAIQITETTTQLTLKKITSKVKDPDRTVTKGRKKRLKGHLETSKKKGSKSSTQNDFATNTRKKHII